MAKSPDDKIKEAQGELVESIEDKVTKEPKTYFVFDRDTIMEAEVTRDNKDGTLDLICQNVANQKFMTDHSSPPEAREFKRVRKGTWRGDVGTFFQE